MARELFNVPDILLSTPGLIFVISIRKLNIYNALIKSSLLYRSETWRLTENNKGRSKLHGWMS